jgi:hypothetical protein|nr:MAG TPA: protein of unknown function (DUF5320) [Bacteriophage sp.]
MMSNKNEVFEYLIDQLRQQLPVVDVMGEIERWSIDRSIAGRGNYTDEENVIIDAYIGLEHNTYKQQCEDLAQEVQSLKNQLRDASAQIKELQEDNIRKSEHISHMTGQSSAYRNDALRFQAQVDDLVKRLATATGDVEAYKLIRKGGYISGGQRYVVGEHGPEQSGCRKEDTQECNHTWRFVNGKAPAVCINCGVTKSSECEHEWQFYGVGFPCMCIKCGLKK